MIHVIATIELKPGTREAFLGEFHALMPQVHAEQGCLEYGPAVDVATGLPPQPPLRDNVVVVVEKWESIDALKAHLQADHMNRYRERVKEMVASVELRVLEPV
jgi:quinol monooxygenase YgiN